MTFSNYNYEKGVFMIYRERYMDKLIKYADNDFVKIVSGVRRCGKSSLLTLFKTYLLEQGVSEEQIIEINYEKYQFNELTDGKELHDYIHNNLVLDQKLYLLIDEIQELAEWAKVVNSLRVSFHADIYVTGSNARMFSGEHLSYLSGRYVEIKVLPLSFKEFLEFKAYTENHIEDAFNEYLQVGSFH